MKLFLLASLQISILTVGATFANDVFEELGIDGQLDIGEGSEQILDKVIQLHLSSFNLFWRAIDFNLIFRVSNVHMHLITLTNDNYTIPS